MLDYKLIEAFAAVLEEGGFERAASVLHITQSAVSQRIKQLEDRLGQALIIRSTPVRPTEAGQRLRKHFRQVMHLEGNLLDELNLSETSTGWVTMPLAVNDDSLTTWFLPAVTPLLTEERILIDVTVADQDITHELLHKGEVLGCVSSNPTPMQGGRCELLGCMEYCCVAAPEYANTWFPNGMTTEAAQNAPTVTYNRADDLQNRFLHNFGVVPGEYPSHYVPNADVFIRFCASGLAHGMVPRIQAESYFARGKLIELTPEHNLPVNLYWHHWNLHTMALSKLTQAIKQAASTVLT